MKAIINGKIILSEKVLEGYVLVFDETIKAITKELPKDVEIIDVKGQFVSPGFIDIHIHGSNGADVMDGKEESLDIIANTVLKCGVTSFLATTMTLGKTDITKSFKAVSDYMKKQKQGAKIQGIHVEGPFINPVYKGAQNDKYIIAPDYKLIQDHTDIIKLMTVAPEVDGMMDFVKLVKSKHPSIKFSIGHSAATYEEAVESYSNGVDSTTHLFNGMTGLHHRKPGIVGAVFKKKPYFEVIADKIHVHTALFDIVGDCVGKEKMILITDAMCACHMLPGTYELGGQKVLVDETSARLESGALAGSILKMNESIKNIMLHTDYKIEEVVKMTTENPCNMLGLKNIGKIENGYYSDLTIFDEEYNVNMTIVNGQIRFRKGQ